MNGTTADAKATSAVGEWESALTKCSFVPAVMLRFNRSCRLTSQTHLILLQVLCTVATQKPSAGSSHVYQTAVAILPFSSAFLRPEYLRRSLRLPAPPDAALDSRRTIVSTPATLHQRHGSQWQSVAGGQLPAGSFSDIPPAAALEARQAAQHAGREAV